jgi:hypothetical protein
MLDRLESGASVKVTTTARGGCSSDAPAGGSELRTRACAPAPAALPTSHNVASARTSSIAAVAVAVVLPLVRVVGVLVCPLG